MRLALFITMLAVALAGLSEMAFADGFIVLRPPRPEIIPIPLAVKYHHVDVKIEDQVAFTSIDQVFYNPNAMQLEGTYLFPLPKGAAVSGMSMWINGQETKGELLPRDEAVKIYTDIVRRMKDPAVLEYMGSRLFRMRIFPIEPHSEKRIKIEYAEELEMDSGLVTYRYPLSTEKFSSQPLDDVLVNISLNCPVPVKTIYSPSHQVEIVRKSDKQAQISYEAKRVVPDKDFILYFGASEGRFGATLVTSKQKTQDGFFSLFIAPRHEIRETEIIAKDIVFVVDTSGSMKEPAAKPWKIDQAKEALQFCINSLGAKDRFNVISFATGTGTFRKTLQPVNNDTRAEAGDFIASLDARGGTNIHAALEALLAMQTNDATRPFIIVFLTDGQPTLGELQSAEELVGFVNKQAGANMRFFTFGVGYDVNTHLLDKLAITNRGDRVYVSPEESIEVKVSGFYDKIAYPVLSDISLAIDGVGTYDLVPAQLPDLFRGSQLVIHGRYKGHGHSAIRLKGKVQGKSMEFIYENNFPEVSADHPHIPRLWALTKIGYLLDQLRLKGFDVDAGFKPSGPERELVNEIVALATEYGVVTPYTAMLVLEDTKHRAPGTISPAGIRMVHAGGAGGNTDFSQGVSEARDSLGRKSGKLAFDASRSARRLQSSLPMPAEKEEDAVSKALNTSKTFRQVADKTFVLVDGTWFDSTYKQGSAKTEVAFLSEAYFKLIEDNPEIARYLSVGARVVVCLDKKVFAVVP